MSLNLQETQVAKDGTALLGHVVGAIKTTFDVILSDVDTVIPKLEGDALDLGVTLAESFIPGPFRAIFVGILEAGNMAAHAAVLGSLGALGHAILMSAKLRVDAAFDGLQTSLDATASKSEPVRGGPVAFVTSEPVTSEPVTGAPVTGGPGTDRVSPMFTAPPVTGSGDRA